jgi:hypothetical protein
MNEAGQRPRPIRRCTAPDHISTVNNERIVFTAADRVPKRKSRKRLGGGFIDDKNRDILESIIVWGWLSRVQLSDLLNIPAVTIHRRAQRLASVGLLNDRVRGVAGEILYTPTRKGMRLVGMANFKISAPSPQTMNHTEGLFALALRFGESPSRHGIVVTEREIEVASTTGQLSRRIQRLAPWAQSQFEGKFATWKPVAEAASGSGIGFKRPDMLLIKQNEPPTAVELEITQKSTIQQYVRILEAYNRAQQAGHLANPIIYVTVEVAGNHDAIKKALETSFTRANLGRRMTLRFLVFTIGIEYWNPRSAKNGWFNQKR